MQRTAQVSRTGALQDLAAMLTDGADSVDAAGLATDDKNTLAGRLRGKAVTRIGDLLLPADTDPATREHRLLLEGEEIRVGVASAGQHMIGSGWQFSQDRVDLVHAASPAHRPLNSVATTCS